MDSEEKKPFQLSSLPLWVPVSAVLLSFVMVLVGIVGTFTYVASSIKQASDPIDPALIDAKFPQVEEAPLGRLLLRLEGVVSVPAPSAPTVPVTEGLLDEEVSETELQAESPTESPGLDE